jgi:hypothetical protein
MLKKSLIGLAVVAMMVSVAQAGALKTEGWTIVCSYAPQDVCTLRVMLKVPWWIKITPEPDIWLTQIKFYDETVVAPDKPDFGKADYQGISDPMEVCANFDGKLSVATPVPTTEGVCLGGKWSASISPTDFAKCCTPGFVVTVKLEKATLHCLEACQEVHVANVTIKVVPTKAPVCEVCP